MRLLAISVLTLMLLVFGLPVHADLILSAPPRETADKGKALYGPLATYLSKLFGKKVIYVHPNNWLEYQHDLRNDRYDIIFDGPHFISWRIHHLKNDVLVKLPGKLEFVIIAKAGDKEVKKMNNLIGKKICGIPPPNLGSLTVIDQFRNPVRQPIVWGVPGGNVQVFKAFTQGKCRAAVLVYSFYKKKLTNEQRKNTRVLFHSKGLPNQGISVSTRISARFRNKMITALTKGPGRKYAEPIAKRFNSGRNVDFVAAKNKEYNKYNDLLEGVVFGW